MKMHAENLASALVIAIREQRKIEQAAGYYSDSVQVAGWVQVLEALHHGEHITIDSSR